MVQQTFLTTVDNPYDPQKQFDDWFRYDTEKGYNTCSYLDRIANVSDDLSEEEKDVEYERAMDEIIKYDFSNVYTKVKKEIGEYDDAE